MTLSGPPEGGLYRVDPQLPLTGHAASPFGTSERLLLCWDSPVSADILHVLPRTPVYIRRGGRPGTNANLACCERRALCPYCVLLHARSLTPADQGRFRGVGLQGVHSASEAIFR